MSGSRHGRGADQVSLRLPNGMRDQLKEVAALNGRSLNAEIIQRLEVSLLPSHRVVGASYEDVDGNLYIRAEPGTLFGSTIEGAIASIEVGLSDIREMLRITREAEATQARKDPSE